MLVHVRWSIVLKPSACVNPASSRLLSLVDPPAPHVMLIAKGFKEDNREIRDIRLSNPWNGATVLELKA